MTAELLRQAAMILRERAEAASNWNFDSGVLWIVDYDPACNEPTPMQRQVGGADAPWGDYIATMHPGVGLAIADWLDTMALVWVGGGRHVFGLAPSGGDQSLAKDDAPIDPTSLMGRALDVARLINGSAS